MENTFLKDQFEQLSKIFKSYQDDIASLDHIVNAWEESGVKDTKELSEKIESSIVNKTSISLLEDESGQLLMEMTFHPIKVAWLLKKQDTK